MSALTKEYGNDEAKNLFKCFIEKGILEECGTGFAVPIPSMHTWLKGCFAKEKIDLSREQQKVHVERGRDSGFER